MPKSSHGKSFLTIQIFPRRFDSQFPQNHPVFLQIPSKRAFKNLFSRSSGCKILRVHIPLTSYPPMLSTAVNNSHLFAHRKEERTWKHSWPHGGIRTSTPPKATARAVSSATFPPTAATTENTSSSFAANTAS